MTLITHSLSPSGLPQLRGSRDSPGTPVVKTSTCTTGGTGLIPGQGTKIPHAAQHRQKNKNRRQKPPKEKKQNKTQKQTKIKTRGSKGGQSEIRFAFQKATLADPVGTNQLMSEPGGERQRQRDKFRGFCTSTGHDRGC